MTDTPCAAAPTLRMRTLGTLRATLATLMTLVMLIAGPVRASPPAPGTSINNTAKGSYLDPRTGQATTLISNTVAASVAPFEALTLTHNQTLSQAPATGFALPHVLTNTGNVTTAYTLTLTATGGNAAAATSLVIDQNANGLADPGEPTIANGATLTLAPGALANLLVTGTIPAADTAGQIVQLKLTAATATQPGGVTDTDTVTILSGPLVTVSKSASTANPVPGANLTYTLVAQNSGGGAAAGAPITVNGLSTNAFVLRDAVPANTTLATLVSTAPNAQLIYHRLGDPAGSYQTVRPSTPIDGVAVTVPTLPPTAALTASLTVTVNGNAAGQLSNTAYADFNDGTANRTTASNAVTGDLPALPPTITFYANGAYAAATRQSGMGAPLYLQINAAQCNTNASAIVTHPVTLVSTLTNDTETFIAVETAPNTGVFRVVPNLPTADAAVHPVVSGDGILEVRRNDRVVATLSGCGGTASTSVLIDPSGVVFDSRTNAAISNATVLLIDVSGAGNGGHPNAPAVVYLADGVTPAPSTVTTLIDGTFSFPSVALGTYKLAVTPPNGYAFPSKRSPAELPAGHDIDPTASYGGTFTLAGAGASVTVDVPLDAGPAGGLFLQKIASKSLAAIGDFVDYTLTLGNGTGLTLPAAVISDELPQGFAYIAGSARLNGTPLGNPAGGAGPHLQFGVGTLPPATSTILTYRVRIGASAAAGTGINTAQVASGITHSNAATATVKLTDDVLSDKAYIIGKVYADCDGNRQQDRVDSGVPGVRIYLDDGTYAVTDSEGKYSLYGLTPRTHVAKLDTTTLPVGATLEILDNRNARDAGSQFVDLQNGELHKVDFALAGCSTAVDDLIRERRRHLLAQPSEITTAAITQLSVNPRAAIDPRTLASTGVIGKPPSVLPTTAAPGAAATPGLAAPQGATAASGATGSPGSDAPPGSAAPQGSTTSPALPEGNPLAQLLPTLTPAPAFINLTEGQVIPSGQTRVQVKGAFHAELGLRVNGRDIGMAQVSQQSSLETRGVTAWEYLGVDLQPGENLLELIERDAGGNVRGSAEVHVIAPGALAQLKLSAPPEANADSATPIEVMVELQDAHGVRIDARTELTLEANLGEWQTPDLDPKTPGTQVFVEGGTGHFRLAPPALPGKAAVRVSSGAVRSETQIVFVPLLRPMLAAGIAEGIVSLRSLSSGALQPVQSGDAFEREIGSASRSFDGGKDDAAAHASLYLKGKVLGSSLLTMAYDSDKPADTAFLRDIQPDQFYPVYGDSSVKGYDAQSTGKLYVRLDHGTSYGLYGDYTTQSDNPARLLTQYSRALNGAKTHVEDGALTADGFASYTNTTQVIDELPANGTSGPYQLSQRNPVLNSQRVDIITRDRNQPSLVLADVSMAEFTDYAVEPLTGQILFKAPVPSLDANLNPIYVRVAYEVDEGGPSYWVAGVDLREKLSTGFTVGGTYIRDANPVDRQTLGGANFLWTPDKETSLIGELARSQSDLAGSGEAHRLEFKHADARVQARVYAVQTDPNFYNPSSTFNAGAAEYGAKASAAFDAKNRLVFEALKTTTASGTIQTPSSIPLVGVPEAVSGGGSRQGESLALEHTLPLHMKLTTGLRRVDSNDQPTQLLAVGAVPNNYTSARVRLDAPVPDLPKANAFVQYEEALDDTHREDATVGATYQVAPQTKLYATHQTSDSLSGDYALNPSQQLDATVIGIDTTYMQDGKLFNEYRVGDGVDGRDARAAIGLRNLWTLEPGLGLTTSLQQVHPISGDVTDRATAVTGGLEYTANPDWKGSTRLEWSKSATAQTWLASMGAAVKLDADLTALARGVYNEQLGSADSGGVYLRQVQMGVAYRPVESNVWNALAWVEHKRSENATQGVGLNVDESANIFSTHVNYQPDADWLVNGRYAVKGATDDANGLITTYTSQIIGARATWDVSRNWDLGAQYFVEFGGAGDVGRRQAVGGEIGYTVMKNLWLSVGYNVLGFTDHDLAGEDYTQRAFYLRLRFKFDENLFKPGNNAQALPAGAAVMK